MPSVYERYPVVYELIRQKKPRIAKECIRLLEREYSSVAPLQYLEGNQAGSKRYRAFFNALLDSIPGSATEGEMRVAIAGFLNSQDILKKQLLVLEGSSQQLGFHEKLHQDTQQSYEHFTRFDMLRGSAYFNKKPTTALQAGVYSLYELESIKSPFKSSVLFVDVSLEQEASPKWTCCFVSRQTRKVCVYTESPLNVDEIKKIQAIATKQNRSFTILGGNAAHSYASGLIALAYYNSHIRHSPSSGVVFGADYPYMLEQYFWMSSVHGLHKDLTESRAHTRGFTYKLLNAANYKTLTQPNETLSFWNIVRYSIQGFEHRRHVPGDLRLGADLVSAISSEKALLSHRIFNAFSTIPGLEEAMKKFEVVQGTGLASASASKELLREARLLLESGNMKAANEAMAAIKEIEGVKNRQIKALRVNGDTTALTIPNQLEIGHIDGTGSVWIPSAKTNILARCYDSIQDKGAENNYLGVVDDYKMIAETGFSREDYYATAMLICTLRTSARRANLSINVYRDDFIPDQKTTAYIRSLMGDNPFLQQITLSEGCPQSLQDLVHASRPTLARNKWLSSQGYKPPLRDKYWQRAAEKWLVYLSENPDVLIHADKHQEFLFITKSMGTSGVEAMLALVSTEADKNQVSLLCRDRQVAFNACDMRPIIEHLKAGKEWPFDSLSVQLSQADAEQHFAPLIEQLLERTELAFLMIDPSEPSIEAMRTILNNDVDKLAVGTLTIPIVMPYLESNVRDVFQEDVDQYRRLNNQILQNIRSKNAQLVCQKVETHADLLDAVSAETVMSHRHAQGKEDFVTSAENFSRYLSSSGQVELQMQQQQQQQQQMQVSRKVDFNLAEKRPKVLTQPLPADLLDYNNIDQLLANFCSTKTIDPEAVVQALGLEKKAQETALQTLFRNWIGTNPNNYVARDIIGAMTIDAAQRCLLNANKLCSGLSVDNLPRGFSLQPDLQGRMVLGYDALLGYTRAIPNACTVEFDDHGDERRVWLGDFRQFDDLTEAADDWKDADNNLVYMCLFASFQPNTRPEKNSAAYQSALGAFTDDIDFIHDHWQVINQAWGCAGDVGVAQLVQHKETVRVFLSDTQRLYPYFFKDGATRAFATQYFNDAAFKSLGQLYNKFGAQGVTIFMKRLQVLTGFLSSENVRRFIAAFLESSVDASPFLMPGGLDTLNEIIKKAESNPACVSAFINFCQCHKNVLPCETHITLWNAFSSLVESGLPLQADSFAGFHGRKENMLVIADRICRMNEHLDEDEKAHLLATASSRSLRHGDEYYAVTREGFFKLDDTLALQNFTHGMPTYRPDLRYIHAWDDENLALYFKRILASHKGFTSQLYNDCCEAFGTPQPADKPFLVFLCFCQHLEASPQEWLRTLREKLEGVPINIKNLLMRHIIDATNGDESRPGNADLLVSVAALVSLSTLSQAKLGALVTKYPHGTVLECVTLWQYAKVHQEQSIDRLASLVTFLDTASSMNSHSRAESLLKIAVLFGMTDIDSVKQLLSDIQSCELLAEEQISMLISQILSVDITQQPARIPATGWVLFSGALKEMVANPDNAVQARDSFMATLQSPEHQMRFKKAIVGGDYRQLADEEIHYLGCYRFGDKQARIEHFIKHHMLISSEVNDEIDEHCRSELVGLLTLFERLRTNSSFIDELEPLISVLGDTPKGCFWTAEFMASFLVSLTPSDQHTPFPLNVVCILLKESIIAAREATRYISKFPPDLTNPLQSIINNASLTTDEKTLCCQLCIRSYAKNQDTALAENIVQYISQDVTPELRQDMLSMILASGAEHYESSYEHAQKLLTIGREAHGGLSAVWTRTLALWLSANKQVLKKPILDLILAKSDELGGKMVLILHILAYSTLTRGVLSAHEYDYQLSHKLAKLTDRLFSLSSTDLSVLSRLYPKSPSPDASRVLWMIKTCQQQSTTAMHHLVDEFNRDPTQDIRRDYRKLLKTRQADFKRMLDLTKIRDFDVLRPLSMSEAMKLSMSFSYLRALENGDVQINGQAVYRMTEDEIKAEIASLQGVLHEHPYDTKASIQVLALLFESLGRTTGKYPHLAQQYALLVNRLIIHSDKRALRLSTGEGKSHYVAMQAALQALHGKGVNICTAKETLAARDQHDYQQFFESIGLKTAVIKSDSLKEEYDSARIHYTTLGGLSLFLDSRSDHNEPVSINKENSVFIFDELDYIFFEEGLNTGFNYARRTGHSPKDMSWFYDSLNEFYDQHLSSELKEAHKPITQGILLELLEFLHNKSKGYPKREQYFQSILAEGPGGLFKWLQSTHRASLLVKNTDFTIQDVEVEYNEVRYPMREIIPLSRDNQPIKNSSFSDGVHQLLASRLNRSQPDLGAHNFHIHPESSILTSHIAEERARELCSSWDGCTGSLSYSQSYQLSQAAGVQTLEVPTNRQDRRVWHPPSLVDDDQYEQEIIINVQNALRAKKSILLACRDDREVDAMGELLQRGLLPGEYAQVMVYTNRENRDVSDVLAEKFAKEYQGHSKKQAGVCLLSSSLGRGDNPDVNVVIISDIRDENDLLQRGGRTARFGSKGEVYQIYKRDVLLMEYQRLIAGCNALLGETIESEISPENDVTFLREVNRLREKYAFLNSQKEMMFKRVRSQFSTWVMNARKTLTVDELKASFDKQVFVASGQAEDNWRELVVEDKSLEELYADIGRLYQETAQLIDVGFHETLDIDDATSFNFTPFIASEYHSIHAEPMDGFKEKQNPQMPLILELATQLERMEFSNSLMADDVLQKIEDLQVFPHLLMRLLQKARQFDKAEDFHEELEELHLAIERGEGALYQFELSKDEFDVGLNDADVKAYSSSLEKLSDAHQDLIQTFLLSGLRGNESNISRFYALKALLTYLTQNGMTDELQNDYLRQLNTLCPYYAGDTLRDMFSNLGPMPYEQFQMLWALGEKYHLNTDELRLAQHAFANKTQDILQQIEFTVDMLDDDGLFVPMLNKLGHMKNKSLFGRLVDASKAYWVKNQGKYQGELKALWDQLASEQAITEDDEEIIEAAVTIKDKGGKFWFAALLEVMALDPAIRSTNKATIVTLMRSLAEKETALKLCQDYPIDLAVFDKKASRLTFLKRQLDKLNPYALTEVEQLFIDDADNRPLFKKLMAVGQGYIDAHGEGGFFHGNTAHAKLLANLEEQSFITEKQATESALRVLRQLKNEKSSLAQAIIDVLRRHYYVQSEDAFNRALAAFVGEGKSRIAQIADFFAGQLQLDTLRRSVTPHERRGPTAEARVSINERGLADQGSITDYKALFLGVSQRHIDAFMRLRSRCSDAHRQWVDSYLLGGALSGDSKLIVIDNMIALLKHVQKFNAKQQQEYFDNLATVCPLSNEAAQRVNPVIKAIQSCDFNLCKQLLDLEEHAHIPPNEVQAIESLAIQRAPFIVSKNTTLLSTLTWVEKNLSDFHIYPMFMTILHHQVLFLESRQDEALFLAIVHACYQHSTDLSGLATRDVLTYFAKNTRLTEVLLVDASRFAKNVGHSAMFFTYLQVHERLPQDLFDLVSSVQIEDKEALRLFWRTLSFTDGERLDDLRCVFTNGYLLPQQKVRIYNVIQALPSDTLRIQRGTIFSLMGELFNKDANLELFESEQCVQDEALSEDRAFQLFEYHLSTLKDLKRPATLNRFLNAKAFIRQDAPDVISALLKVAIDYANQADVTSNQLQASILINRLVEQSMLNGDESIDVERLAAGLRPIVNSMGAGDALNLSIKKIWRDSIGEYPAIEPTDQVQESASNEDRTTDEAVSTEDERQVEEESSMINQPTWLSPLHQELYQLAANYSPPAPSLKNFSTFTTPNETMEAEKLLSLAGETEQAIFDNALLIFKNLRYKLGEKNLLFSSGLIAQRMKAAFMAHLNLSPDEIDALLPESEENTHDKLCEVFYRLSESRIPIPQGTSGPRFEPLDVDDSQGLRHS